jgi:hypothetical protein
VNIVECATVKKIIKEICEPSIKFKLKEKGLKHVAINALADSIIKDMEQTLVTLRPKTSQELEDVCMFVIWKWLGN